jgi:sulfide:quinone oxidoreductase
VYNWDKIKGLKEAIVDNNRPVASIYYYPRLEKVKQMREKKVQKAIFTQAVDPISCAAAPQKIMYTTCDFWKKNNSYPEEVKFYQHGPKLFGVKFYSDALEKIADGYKVDRNNNWELIEVKIDLVLI